MNSENSITPFHLAGRSVMLLGVPSWTMKQIIDAGGLVGLWKESGLIVKGILVIYAPTFVICGAGALECTVRTIVDFVLQRKEQGRKDFQATQAFFHGMLFPPNGCALMYHELDKKLNERRNLDKRILINDVAVLYGTYLVGKGLCKVIKYSAIYSMKVVKHTFIACSTTAVFAGSLLQKGLGKICDAADQVFSGGRL